MNAEEGTGYVRRPIQSEVRYDPRDIPPEFLRMGLRGSETEVDVLEYAGGSVPKSIFHVLSEDYSPHEEAFRKNGFGFIKISGTPFPVELLGDRTALEKYHDEYLQKDRVPERKKSKETVEGGAQDIVNRIAELFGANLPAHTELVFDERESGISTGSLVTESIRYSSTLTVKLKLKGEKPDGSDDRFLNVITIKSRDSYSDSSSGPSGEGNTYSYEVALEKLEKIIEK